MLVFAKERPKPAEGAVHHVYYVCSWDRHSTEVRQDEKGQRWETAPRIPRSYLRHELWMEGNAWTYQLGQCQGRVRAVCLFHRDHRLSHSMGLSEEGRVCLELYAVARLLGLLRATGRLPLFHWVEAAACLGARRSRSEGGA